MCSSRVTPAPSCLLSIDVDGFDWDAVLLVVQSWPTTVPLFSIKSRVPPEGDMPRRYVAVSIGRRMRQSAGETRDVVVLSMLYLFYINQTNESSTNRANII